MLKIINILVLENKFNKINSKLSESYKSNSYEFEELKTSKLITALLKKDLNRYLS